MTGMGGVLRWFFFFRKKNFVVELTITRTKPNEKKNCFAIDQAW